MALEPSWTLVDSAGVVHVVAGRSALSQMFGKNTKPTYNNMLELVGEGSRGVVGYLCKDGWRMLRELPWLQHKESKRIVPVVGSAAQFLQRAAADADMAGFILNGKASQPFTRLIARPGASGMRWTGAGWDRLHFAPPAALLLEHGANVNSVQHSTLGPLVPLVPFQVRARRPPPAHVRARARSSCVASPLLAPLCPTPRSPPLLSGRCRSRRALPACSAARPRPLPRRPRYPPPRRTAPFLSSRARAHARHKPRA